MQDVNYKVRHSGSLQQILGLLDHFFIYKNGEK
jgi:hypothetical protein